MPIDVSILRQQAPMQMPSLMESRARANQLISSDMQMAANMLQLQKAQREQQEQEQVRNLLTGGQFDFNAPEGAARLAALGAPGREAVKTFAEAAKMRREEQKLEREGEAARLKGVETRLNIVKQQVERAAKLLPTVKDYPSAKRYLAVVWGSAELAEDLRKNGQTPEGDDAEVQQSIATGKFKDWLLREAQGASEIYDVIATQIAGAAPTPDSQRQAALATGSKTAVDVTKPPATPASIQEYEYARRQGYKGTFEQWEKQQGAAKASRVSVGIGEQLSPGQKKVDEKFADDYVQWTSGDRARSEMGLSTMGNVIRDLKAGKTLSGPILALVPDALLAFSSTGAASVKAREDIERIVQEDLRATLGPQFTEKEGTGFLKRVFNPSLSGPQLLDRLERLYRQMDVARQQRDAMAAHFEANETLRGYKGPRPSLVDFQSSIFGGGKGADKDAAPAAPAKTPEAFSDAEKERAYQEWKRKKK